MKKTFLYLALIVISISTNAQKSISPDGVFNYQINVKHELAKDLLAAVKKSNPNIIQLEIVTIKGENIPFAISKYEGGEVTIIEVALKDYVYNVKANSITKTIEAKSFTKEGRVFHRKITISSMGDKNVYNVMYYFMKNNKSKFLYEIKLSANNVDQKLIDHTLYNIAKTVYFK